MRFRSFSSLRFRLISLVLLAALPALALTLYTGLEARHQARVAAQEDARRLSQLAAATMEQMVEGARQLLVTLAWLPEVHDLDAARCSAGFAILNERFPVYVGLAAARPDGDVFCSHLPLSQPVNLADRGYFQRVLETRGLAISDYQIGRLSGKPVLVFAYPVLDAQGRIEAVVTAALDLSALDVLATESDLPAGAALTVSDRGGAILFRYPEPEKWAGKALPDTPLIDAIQERRQGGQAEVPGVDGVTRLYAFTPVHVLGNTEDTGLSVSVGMATQLAYAGANRILARNLAWLGLATLLAIAAAWFGSHTFLMRPINALVSATRRLASGDLGARTHLPGGAGELSQLAGAFDQMAETLELQEAERKRAEESLRASEERFRSVTQSAGDAIIVADGRGTILAWNRGAQIMFGYAEEEALGQSLTRLMPELYRESHQAGLERLASTGRPKYIGQTLRLEGRRKNGSDFPLEASLSAWQTGGVAYYSAIIRDITKRQQTEKEIALRLAELEAVNRISTAMRAAQTLDEMLPLLLNETLAVMGSQAGVIWLYEAANDELRRAIARGWLEEIDEPAMKPGEEIAGAVFETGEPHLSREFASDPMTRASTRPRLPTGWGGACIPIRTSQQVIGAMFVAVRLPRELSPAEVRLLITIAEIAGNAIQRTGLHEQTERRLKHVAALVSIGQAISGSVDLRPTLDLLLEHVIAELGVDAADVLLLTPHRQTLEYAAGRGFRTSALRHTRLRIGEGLAGQAVLEHRLVRVADLSSGKDGLARSVELPAEGFVSYFGAPLVAKGASVGVLEIFHRTRLAPAVWGPARTDPEDPRVFSPKAGARGRDRPAAGRLHAKRESTRGRLRPGRRGCAPWEWNTPGLHLPHRRCGSGALAGDGRGDPRDGRWGEPE